MRLYSYDMTETDGLSVGSNYTHYINVLPKGDKHLKIFFSKEYNVTAAPVGAYATCLCIYCQLSAVITSRAVAIGIS